MTFHAQITPYFDGLLNSEKYQIDSIRNANLKLYIESLENKDSQSRADIFKRAILVFDGYLNIYCPRLTLW
jgi:hypothetical protein